MILSRIPRGVLKDEDLLRRVVSDLPWDDLMLLPSDRNEEGKLLDGEPQQVVAVSRQLV